MKIAYFTESLPPMVDGVTRTLVRLVDTLEKERLTYRFYSPVKPDESIPWRENVHKVPSAPFPLYSYYRVSWPYFHGLERELDALNPNLLHVCSPTLLGMYALRYAQKKRLPVVTSYHTHFVSYFPYYGLKQMERIGWCYLQWFHNQCLCTLAPSRNAAEQLREQGIENVALWPRGVDVKRFSPLHRSKPLRRTVGAANQPLLLFVGRLVKEKDLDDLAEAAIQLRKSGYRFSLVLIGDGPMRSELEQRLPFAHFVGKCEGELLAQWYASADVFVFPSTTETFGNVILESFASAIPAVGVARGGVADLIIHGVNGLLTAPNAPSDFARAIRKLLDDEQYCLQLGRQARISVTQYDWDVINQKLLIQYENIVKKHPHRRAA